MSEPDEYRDFTARLHRFVRHRLDNAHDAEDIVQDALLKLHAHAATFRTDRERTAWVFRVARNSIIDLHRRHARRQDVAFEDSIAAPAPAPRAASVKCLPEMINRLAPEYRNALRLSDVDGLSSAQVASQTGLSISGAKSRVQRARSQVRGMLLDCCNIEFDARGGLLDFQPTERSEEYCGAPCGGR